MSEAGDTLVVIHLATAMARLIYNVNSFPFITARQPVTQIFELNYGREELYPLYIIFQLGDEISISISKKFSV